MAPKGNTRERVRSIFEEGRVERERVEFVDRSGRLDYLAKYRDIDICLDTFPYNGTTTTCESLWMGVPVLTLPGQTHVSRVGASLLTNAGLPEMVAATTDAFVETTMKWTGDTARLSQYRKELRGKLLDSPLLEARRFSHDFETALARACGRNPESAGQI